MNNIQIYFATILLVISCIECNINYQMRQVYFMEGDNVCAKDQSDKVKIIFSFEDEIVETYVFAGVGCTWSFDSEFWSLTAVSVIQVNIDEDPNHEIYFNVKLERRNPYGIKREIYTTSTLRSKTIVYGNRNYNCELRGDGTVQHYNKKDEPITAIFNVICQRIY